MAKKKTSKQIVPNKKQTEELQKEMLAIVECISWIYRLNKPQQARVLLYLAHYFNVPTVQSL